MLLAADHLQWSNLRSGGTWGVLQGHDQGLVNIAQANPIANHAHNVNGHQQLGPQGIVPEMAPGESAAVQVQLPLPDPPAPAATAAPTSRELGPHLAMHMHMGGGGPDAARAVVADEVAATALYFHINSNRASGSGGPLACAAPNCTAPTGATMSPMKRSFYTMFSDASDDAPDDLDTCIVDCTHVEKKRRLTVQQLRALESNFDKENKLEPERKMQLAHDLGLQPRQVAVWFQNRRARWKNKQLEKDYDQLKLEYDNLVFERDNLQSQVRLLTTKLQAFEPPNPKPDGDDAGISQHTNRLKVEEIQTSPAPVSGTSTSTGRLQPRSTTAFHDNVRLRNQANEDEDTPADVAPAAQARAAESEKGESFLELAPGGPGPGPGPGSSGFALSPANSAEETGMALTEGSTTCATGYSGEVGTMATLADNTSMMGYDMSQVSSPIFKVSSPSDSSMVSTTSLSKTPNGQQPTAQDIQLVAAVDLPALCVNVTTSEASVISAATFPPCVPESANAMPALDSIPADQPPMAYAVPLEALDTTIATSSGPGQHLLVPANATSTEAPHHIHVPYSLCHKSQTDHIHHSQLQADTSTPHDLTPGPVPAVVNQASTSTSTSTSPRSGVGVPMPSRSVVSADNFLLSFADPSPAGASTRARPLQGLRRNLSSPSLHQVNHNLCQLNLCPMGLSQAAAPEAPPAIDIAPSCEGQGPGPGPGSASPLSELPIDMALGVTSRREPSGLSTYIFERSTCPASTGVNVSVNVAGGYAAPRPVGNAHGPLLSSTYDFMKSRHLNKLAKLVIPSMFQTGGHGLPLNLGAVTAVSRTVTDYASPKRPAGSMSNVSIFHVPPAAAGDSNGGDRSSTEPLHRPQVPTLQAQPQPQAFAQHHPFQQVTFQAAKVEPESDFVQELLPRSADQCSSSQFEIVDSRSEGLPCDWWEV